MRNSSISKSDYKSIGWSFVDRFGTQASAFGFNIFLTRIIDPEDFGLIGMIMVFMALGQALVDSGMTSSLIRKKETDALDFSVVFIGNLIFSVVIYVIIFLAAPSIADFYDQVILTKIIRVYGLGFIFIALSAIQQTILVKQMKFRLLTRIRLPATLISGIIAVVFALNDFGVWSLVIMYLTNQILLTLFFWFFGDWKLNLSFQRKRFLEHFSFGYKLSFASILNTIFDNIYYVIIGKFFSVTTLGFYTRAHTMKQYPVETFSSALQRVTYPMFAENSNNLTLLRANFRELTQRVIFIITPVMILGSALAKPLFLILFGDIWLPAVPFFQLLCFTGILYPVHSYNLNILNVFGRSDLFLRLEIIKKFQVLVLIGVAFQFGVLGLIFAQIIASATSFAINTYFTGKFISYGFWDQSSDILPMILIGLGLGSATWFLVEQFESLGIGNLLQLILLISIGISMYFTACLLLGIPPAQDLVNFTKSKISK